MCDSSLFADLFVVVVELLRCFGGGASPKCAQVAERAHLMSSQASMDKRNELTCCSVALFFNIASLF